VTKIQLRRGTAADWTSTNPLLASGEPGVEEDTGLFKIGNGADLWNDLEYPGDGSVTWAAISDKPAVIAEGATQAAARAAIGAGTSNLTLGTTGSTAKPGNYQPAVADIAGSGAAGQAVLAATTQAAARTAIGAGTSNLALGTTGSTAAAGNDTRLTNTRTPTDESVTFAKLAPALVVTEVEAINAHDNDSTIPTSAAVHDAIEDAIITVNEGPLSIQARGASPSNTDVANTEIIQQAWNDAANVKGGKVWMGFAPVGDEYQVNATLTIPRGVMVEGPSQELCRLWPTVDCGWDGVVATEQITTGEANRFGGMEGFAVDCHGVSKVGFNWAGVVVMQQADRLLAVDATERGHQFDGTQNSEMGSIEAKGCKINFAFLNDCGSNKIGRVESEGATQTDVWFGEDNTLPGYAAFGGLFDHIGPSQNEIGVLLCEYGIATRRLLMDKGFNNTFHSWAPTSHGSTTVQYLLDLGAATYKNKFYDATLNGDGTDPALIVPVRNAGFGNALYAPFVEFGEIEDFIWLSASNYTLIRDAHLAGSSYKVQHTGIGSQHEISFVPIPWSTFGDTASRPDFGDVAPWTYWNTQTNRPNFYSGGVWYDPTAGGGGGGTTPIVGEVPSGTKNGINTVFTVGAAFAAGTTAVYLNGIRITQYTESSSTTITFDDAPLSGDSITIDYYLD
jgi:hypothetical protein